MSELSNTPQSLPIAYCPHVTAPPLVHTTAVIVLRFTLLPSPLSSLEILHPLHIFPELLPPPPHKQNVHTWKLQVRLSWIKLNAATQICTSS